jgi:hypothetical protein
MKTSSLNSGIPCHAKVASRAHIRALYESSETHASTIRTYSFSFFFGGGFWERERERRKSQTYSLGETIFKEKEREVVMQKGSKRRRGRYLYPIPNPTRSSIPRIHIHTIEHVVSCSFVSRVRNMEIEA